MTTDRSQVRRSAQKSSGIRWALTLLVVLIAQGVAPAPAFAWFDWLDQLSGPGPFSGADFEAKFLCVMKRPSAALAVNTVNAAIENTRFVATQLSARPRELDDQNNKQAIEMENSYRPLLAMLEPVRSNAESVANSPAHVFDLAEQLKAIRTLIGQLPDSPARKNLERAWTLDDKYLRELAVPRVRYLPGGVAWGSCFDHPNNWSGEQYKSENLTVQHEDRHPIMSFAINYRFYTNGTFLGVGPSGDPRWVTGDPAHAGSPIHMHAIVLQAAWPLTGNFDLVDGEVGIGLAQFNSAGLPDPVGAVLLEPVRFNIHVPYRVSGPNAGFWRRLPTALSVRLGLVMFPQGFSEDAFAPSPGVRRAIPGNEAVFDKGIVINVGRLFASR